MPLNSIPITDLIQRRTSCRSYDGVPVAPDAQARLVEFLRTESVGLFGTAVRAELVAATAGDLTALKGLGTYGFISGATGYIVGAVQPEAPMALEDFGFVIERALLFATALDLGTVWLGGTFNKSRFADAVGLHDGETLAAAVALGYPADRRRIMDVLARSGARGDYRLPWEKLFYEGGFGIPLSREAAGPYATVLDMVRRAPSASNKQPWRVVRNGRRWYLFMQRTPRYAPRNALLGIADMQRIDMGIAMCHFALTAEELGLSGRWVTGDPTVALPDDLTSYVATWTT